MLALDKHKINIINYFFCKEDKELQIIVNEKISRIINANIQNNSI